MQNLLIDFSSHALQNLLHCWLHWNSGNKIYITLFSNTTIPRMDSNYYSKFYKITTLHNFYLHIILLTSFLKSECFLADRDVYIRLIAEMDLLFGNNVNPSYSEIEKLKFLECCILESLRLNPPQPTVRCQPKTRSNIYLGRWDIFRR